MKIVMCTKLIQGGRGVQKSFYGTDPETFSRNARCEIREIVNFNLNVIT